LEEHRYKFNQLTMQMQHDLDLASSRLQVEFDALSLVHNLRTKEEFTHLAALWKSFANLGFALHALLSAEILFNVGETEKWDAYKVEFVDSYKTALDSSQHLLAEEMIFIPAAIADVAEEIVQELQSEHLHYIVGTWIAEPRAEDAYIAHKRRLMIAFAEKNDSLERLIRAHILGESRLGSIIRPESPGLDESEARRP
jgi:hypothetical protein